MKKMLLVLATSGLSLVSFSQTDEQLKQIDSARKFLATTDFVYPYIDTPPGYIGGSEKWNTYQTTSTVLKDAIKKAKEQKIPAGKYTILLKFFINPDGSLSEVKTTNKPIGYGLEEAAVKFIEGSGKWLPAHVEGKEVKSTVNLPINFTVAYN
jgi:protein TonB